ncbi:hypothetical protein EYF80_018968 [Liparis tanakae]|uniref:Uncharacterized protein n=1 Tax=Liparis tanakae TaxID=230148 RepID=A0A4Z2I0N1_9TELE|nr:hypothetical protein EYF80_018968 [Liparis tanakae]
MIRAELKDDQCLPPRRRFAVAHALPRALLTGKTNSSMTRHYGGRVLRWKRIGGEVWAWMGDGL